MILHHSHYEHEGWIPINKEKPSIGKKVKLAKIRFLDWNLESLEWETTGSITESGLWIVKQTKETENTYSTPTHWKKI